MPKTNLNTKSILAREEDGTIQLTITIPWQAVEKAQEEALLELAKTTEVPGFRPGFAPLEEVRKRVSAQTVLEQVLGKLLPDYYKEALSEHKIVPFLAPKFELVKAQENVDWQVRALTCEAPRVVLGDYQKELEAAKRTDSLWVPGKEKKESSPPEKEQLVLETLLKTVKVTIPKPLLEEEVNHRLSQLITETQKLGLTVEQYLQSAGKTAQTLRQEYQKQAHNQIATMLILSEIAAKENLDASEEEVQKVIQESAGKNGELSETQKEVIREILKRRQALDKLTNAI